MKDDILTSDLTDKEQKDLHQITKKIVETLQPLAIYHYGSRIVHRIESSHFTMEKRKEQWYAGYDLFVISGGNDPINEEAAAVMAECAAGQYTKTNIILWRWPAVEAELTEGNFFLSRILRSAIKLYDKDNRFRQWPSPLFSADSYKMYPETYHAYQSYITQSSTYMNTAKQHFNKKKYAKSLEMLQQAAKYSLKAIIKCATGYDINTNNLERMIRFTENFTDKVIYLFNGGTPEERQLYNLLTGTQGIPEIGNRTLFEIQILLRRNEILYKIACDFLQANPTLLKYDLKSKK